MREQNSSKVFRIAFEKMLNYLKSKGINANDIQDKTGVSAGSISEFKTENI
jgi:hypothetical protein